MKQFIRKLKYFFKNLWHYRIMLREDRQWDFTYVYSYLKFKLDYMYPEYYNTDWSNKHSARYIKIASRLCKMLECESPLLSRHNFSNSGEKKLYLKRCKKLLLKILDEKLEYWWG